MFKKTNDYESIKLVFEKLGDPDDDLFDDLEQLAAKLEKEAGDVLELLIVKSGRRKRELECCRLCRRYSQCANNVDNYANYLQDSKRLH